MCCKFDHNACADVIITKAEVAMLPGSALPMADASNADACVTENR